MAVDEDHSKIMERYQLMKRSLKEALLENEVLQEELRRAQTKLVQITKEKQSLMDRLQARYHDQQYSEEYTSDEDVRWQQHSYAKGVFGNVKGAGGGVTGRGSGRGRGGYSAAQRKQKQQQLPPQQQKRQQQQPQQQHHTVWQHQTQDSGASRRKQMPIPASHFDDGGSTSSQEPPVKRKKSMGPGAAAYAANRSGGLPIGAAPGAPDSLSPHEGRHFSQATHFAAERHSYGGGPAGDDGGRGASGGGGAMPGVGGGGGGGPGVTGSIYEDSVSFDSRHGSYDDRMQYNDNVYYSINESDDSDEHYYPQHVS